VLKNSVRDARRFEYLHICGIFTQVVHSKHSVEIGRLQSKFIGTEFQIFIPTGIQLIKISQSEDVPRATNDAISDKDGALEGCNCVHPIDTIAPAYVANSTSC
jgi:hypothetical protein